MTTYRDIAKNGEYFITFIIRLVHDSTLILLKLINVIFNFWFIETLLIAVLVFGILIFYNTKEHISLTSGNKVNYISDLFNYLKKHIETLFDPINNQSRVFIAILEALLIILTVSPLFWTTLIKKGYLVILLPFILFFICQSLNNRSLSVLGIIFIFSGVIYISSNRMVGYYPPQAFNRNVPVVFQNDFTYANQYLRKDATLSRTPFILNFSKFERFCKICRMGTNEIPFDKYDDICIVGLSDTNFDNLLPPDFTLARKKGVKLTWLDKQQFKYLTPIPKVRYSIYEYNKLGRE
jgi:hypothetical protein